MTSYQKIEIDSEQLAGLPDRPKSKPRQHHKWRVLTDPALREEIIGLPPAAWLDRNALARIWAYVIAWNFKHKTKRHHVGPVTRLGLDILKSILSFGRKTGRWYPTIAQIAAGLEKGKCNKDTVNKAIKALEATGVFSWVNRREWGWIWVRDPSDGSCKRVKHLGRVSNAYLFRDPLPCADRPKTENPAESKTYILDSIIKAKPNLNDALEIALNKLKKKFCTQ